MRLPTRQDGIENRNKVYTAWKNASKSVVWPSLKVDKN